MSNAPSTHQCQARTCTTEVRRGMLMCPHHWRQVPAAIRDEVNRSWGQFRAGAPGSRSAYVNARDAAIDSLAQPLRQDAPDHEPTKQPEENP